MSSSTVSGGVLDQGAAGEPETVVQRDGGGEREEAADQAGAQAVKGASAVAFEREDVFEGPVDRLDALANRGEMRLVGRGVTVGLWGDLRCRPQRRGCRGRGA